MNPVRVSRPVRPRRGFIFYAFAIFVAMAIMVIFGARARWYQDRAVRDTRVLAAARDAILAHLSEPDLDASGRRLGQFGFLPELPNPLAPAFTGYAPAFVPPSGRCATRTWVAGAALTPVDTAGVQARCFGRLPFASLGVDVDYADPSDMDGRIPWLFLSPNLAISQACMADLTPLVVGAPVNNTCPSELPFPWMTVVDEHGNVLSSRVAFALVMPGPPAAGQAARSATSAPGAWMGSLTVLPTCAQPCVPGTYNNATYNQAVGRPQVLATTSLAPDALRRASWLRAPADFRNRVLYVTIDELMPVLERRARKSAEAAMASYFAANTSYPYASALGDGTATCSPGTLAGHLAILQGTCPQPAPVLPSWWTASGWQRYFVYRVSTNCSAGSCNPPGLTLNGTPNVKAVLAAPGAPIVSAPFAPSKGAAQAPLVGGVLSANASDYLDSVVNANALVTGSFTAVTGSSSDDDHFEALP